MNKGGGDSEETQWHSGFQFFVCRLSDTGLFGELEHLKTQTRLIDEKFASVMGEGSARLHP
jgi:hypothetical protein